MEKYSYHFILNISIDYIDNENMKKIQLYDFVNTCKIMHQLNFQDLHDVYIYLNNKYNLNYKII